MTSRARCMRVAGRRTAWSVGRGRLQIGLGAWPTGDLSRWLMQLQDESARQAQGIRAFPSALT